MATPVNFPVSLHGTIKTRVLSGAGATTLYLELDPRQRTGIIVEKNGETATVELTIDTKKYDGTKITDLEDTDVSWIQVNGGTRDYFAGHEKLISGVRIVTNPASANVNISIIQDDPA